MITYLLAFCILTTSPDINADIPAEQARNLKWSQLPAVPDQHGFAGAFSGVSNGALLVAGGANFPDGGAPWTGSTKVWHDQIFVLERPDGKWKVAGKIPLPLGYGVSVSWRDNLVCVGGSNKDGHVSDAFILQYKNGAITTKGLPSLPEPLANSSGALIGDVLFVAGGISTPDAKEAGTNFWSLDLQNTEAGWKQLDTWPGSPRMLGVAGTDGKDFYLFSGVALIDGSRQYLKDAYRYEMHKGWTRLSDLPQSVAAAPSPAFFNGKSSLMIFGGDDGSLAATASQLKEKHPGFSEEILVFNTKTSTWNAGGKIATEKKADAAQNPHGSTWAPVTTSLVVWNGSIVLPSGEVRPAVRTPRVLIATPVK